MALGGQRVYDEDGNPISSTEIGTKKRGLDVTTHEGDKGKHQLVNEELLELIYKELKKINLHLSRISEESIPDKDV